MAAKTKTAKDIQLTLPSVLPLHESYGMDILSTKIESTYRGFWNELHTYRDCSAENLDKYFVLLVSRKHFSFRDTRDVVLTVSNFPLNVARMAGGKWGQRKTMPRYTTVAAAGFISSAYYYAMEVYERVRRRNISVALNQMGRYRALKLWMTKYMDSIADEYNHDQLMCRFTLAAISLNLSFVNILAMVNECSADTTKRTKTDGFMEYLAEEAMAYLPDYQHGVVDRNMMIAILLEHIKCTQLKHQV